MLVMTKDSHTDHGLSSDILSYILERFSHKTAFFIETLELPDDLGTVDCSLVGPATWCDPVAESEVAYIVRANRKCASRVLKYRPDMPKPRTRLITVIAGPHDGRPCVLYTAYGGPLAPREPGDTEISTWDELVRSRTFWAEHALLPLVSIVEPDAEK